jgi:two-component system NtrC family sensor kinase
MHRPEVGTLPSSEGDLPFRQLADHLPALCFMADADGRALWCNQRWYDYTGVAANADLVSVWPSLHDPANVDEALRNWTACIRSGRAGEMIVPFRRADGSFRPFLSRAEPVHGEDGGISCWLGTMTDIGEQQEAARNQRFLVSLGDELRDKNDPAEILSVTGRMLGEQLGVLRVGYGEVGADENDVQAGARAWQATSSEPRLPAEADLNSFGFGLAAQLRRGEVSIVADALSDPNVSEAAAVHLQFGIRASITVPLVKRGRLAAFMYAHAATRREWLASEVQLVSEVAERTWATLERARAEVARRASEEQLRQSEAQLRAIVDATPECVKLVASDGSLQHMNAAGFRMVEADTALLGHDIAEVIVPEDREQWRENHRRVCAGESLTWEFDIIGLRGTGRRMETHAVPLRGADGEVQQLAVSRDVTERRATETALAQSEERFRRVIETAHEGIWLVDDQGNTLFVNDRMASLLGTTRDAMQGKPVPDYCFPEDVDAARERIANNLAGRREQFEFRFRKSDGSALPVLAASTPLQNGEGRVVGAVGMFSDLTERQRAEEKLRNSQALLAAFRNNAPIGMYMKDSDGRYMMLNPEMEKVFGLPIDQVLGRSADELFGPAEAGMINASDREVLQTGQPRSVEEFLPGHDEYAWSLVVRFPIALQDGQPMRVGGFDIDISELKRAEAELQRSREALYQSEKLTALGSLLAGVSHELNNPLSVVLTLSELMQQKSASTPFAERSAKIHAAAARCGKIVQTFLAMARQKAPVRSSVQANDLVQGALGLTAYSLRTAGIRIIQELASGLPAIEADPDQLAQVLVNLLVNAHHALLERDCDRLLTVRTAHDPRSRLIRIEVQDNGPGVAPEIRRRIFDPFFTSKPQGQGTGIGLTFSLGVVEAHGGSIRLDDPPAGGARFTVELPALAEAAQPAVDGSPQQLHERCGCALVIDDEPDLGDALAEMLEDQGYRAEVVRTGEDAKRLIDNQDYDAILSDLRMPGVDGSAMLEWLEERHPGKVQRLAFITGDTLGPTAARFLERAQRPVLEKPFDLAGLRQVLAELSNDADG